MKILTIGKVLRHKEMHFWSQINLLVYEIFLLFKGLEYRISF